MWLSAVIPWATGHHLRLVVLTTFGCPVADVTVWLSQSQGYYTACTTDRAKDISAIVAMKPVDVIVAERTAHLKGSPSAYFTNAQWQSGLVTSLVAAEAERSEARRDRRHHRPGQLAPHVPRSVPGERAAVREREPEPALPSTRRTCPRSRRPPRAERRRVHQPVPWLCTKTCSPVIGTMVVYRDAYHMTNTYAAYLSRVLGAALTTALK